MHLVQGCPLSHEAVRAKHLNELAELRAMMEAAHAKQLADSSALVLSLRHQLVLDTATQTARLNSLLAEHNACVAELTDSYADIEQLTSELTLLRRALPTPPIVSRVSHPL